MKKIINKLIEEYKEKGYEVIIVEDKELSILFNIKVIINNQEYIEDVEVLKESITEDFLRYNFNYLIHNSLNRYLMR